MEQLLDLRFVNTALLKVMSELTNLLSEDRVRALKREYLLRVLTTTAILGSALIIVHATLLVPSYMYLFEELKARTAHLQSLTSAFASSEGQEMGARLAVLNERAQRIDTLTKTPSGSLLVRNILAVPHENIRITGFSLSRTDEMQASLRIVGVSSSREALRRFHEKLTKLSFVSRADLPLSVYAQESDIAFSIALSGTLAP